MLPLRVGQLVCSKAGRDQGNHYVIIGFEKERALVANGRTRLVSKPKAKNPRHLQPYNICSYEVEQLLKNGRLTDLEVRRILAELLERGRQ